MIEHNAVLVTGGAGFIGSHLVESLLRSGSHVTVLDDFSTGNRRNLQHLERCPELRIVRGSVLDAATVLDLISQADAVYHLAAAVGVKNVVDRALESLITNVRGTENVLAAAYEREVPVLLASTSEIYGRNPDAPFSEVALRVLGPTSIRRWSYSTAKAIDEHLAFAYADKGLRVAIVRYFNSYGPRLDSRGYGSVIARLAGQALVGAPMTVYGDGLQTRCFTYVDDTIRGTILAMTTPGALGTAINLGSEEEVTILELAKTIRDMLESRSEIQIVPYESYYGPGFEDTRRRVPDTSRARAVLGFVASIALREGLRRTLNWLRGRREDG